MALLTTSVPLEKLEPGIVLADPGSNRLGQILLNRGTPIYFRQIIILKTWGTQSVFNKTEEIQIKDTMLDQEIRNQALE